eukprot:2950761-Amphidinium_carterae.1
MGVWWVPVVVNYPHVAFHATLFARESYSFRNGLQYILKGSGYSDIPIKSHNDISNFKLNHRSTMKTLWKPDTAQCLALSAKTECISGMFVLVSNCGQQGLADEPECFGCTLKLRIIFCHHPQFSEISRPQLLTCKTMQVTAAWALGAAKNRLFEQAQSQIYISMLVHCNL